MLQTGELNFSPSGSAHHFGAVGPSGNFKPGLSGNFEEKPFSFEEITAMTYDIVSSLRDVRHLPRQEAFMAVMNVTFKYLFRDY